jgi:signal transduction histidine kinase
MNDGRIKALLFLTILVMTVLPLTAAFYFLDHALGTSLDLGFNQPIVQVLNTGSQNLKTLKRLDPGQQDRYREQFEAVERLKRVYLSPDLVKAGIFASLRIYFGLGLAAAALLSVLLAVLLSRSIARSYERTFDDLMHHKEKVRYLEEMASWQELARMLAHEIKNPLTPIEVLVSSLSKAHSSKNEREFREQLGQTQAMVAEELNHLKDTVNKFSEFSRLPSVRLVKVDLPCVVVQLINVIAASIDRADIHFSAPAATAPIYAGLDTTLFRQVLTNIVRNGVEANPQCRVQFAVLMAADADTISVSISNDGPPVPREIASRIFDPYVSGKSGKENMGLGLAIVRKIVIEHGGEIVYAEAAARPVFRISLPRVSR